MSREQRSGTFQLFCGGTLVLFAFSVEAAISLSRAYLLAIKIIPTGHQSISVSSKDSTSWKATFVGMLDECWMSELLQ